ncbi:MAG: hypothetical protein ACXW3D_11775, partial [Caulobacteraceae bacterium]
MTIGERAGRLFPAGAERSLGAGEFAIELAAPLEPGRWSGGESGAHAGEEGGGGHAGQSFHETEHSLPAAGVKRGAQGHPGPVSGEWTAQRKTPQSFCKDCGVLRHTKFGIYNPVE